MPYSRDAGIFWKKVFPQNPHKDFDLVLTHRKELKNFT